MEYESTDNIAIVYETLKNIEIAINRLMERSMEIHNVIMSLICLMRPTVRMKIVAQHPIVLSTFLRHQITNQNYQAPVVVKHVEVLEN